ncbi:MAG: hypothetical protein WCR33_05645 [Bacilli bacterium]
MKTPSQKQEEQIAKMVGGRTQANSGGTRFGGGDVHTKNLLIEAKTPLSDKASFSIKKEWLNKAQEQAFEQAKDNYALAFRFGPDEPDFFVIDGRLFRQLVKYLEEEE